MLTMTDPYDEPPESVLGVLLFNLGNVFTVIFALEALVRMVAMGAWGHPHAYCQDSWNILDLVIVVAGLLEISGASSAKFSMLRTLRILRPLRSVTRIPSLRLLITTIVQSWRPLAHAAAVTIVLTCSLAPAFLSWCPPVCPGTIWNACTFWKRIGNHEKRSDMAFICLNVSSY